MPRLGGVLAVVEDRVPGGPEQGLVVEEEEVRIEDGGAVVAGAGRDRLPRGTDLGPYLLERPDQRFPLGLGVARRAGRNLGIQGAEVARRPGHDPRRSGKPGQRPPGIGRRGRRNDGRSGSGGGGVALGGAPWQGGGGGGWGRRP